MKLWKNNGAAADELQARKERFENMSDVKILGAVSYDERPETKHKVWLHTFWFGRGPIYTYEGSKLPPRLSRAWLVSVHPPYYRGSGIAVRLRKTTLRFGICYPEGRVDADPFDESIDEIRTGIMAQKLYGRTSADKWETEEVEIEVPIDDINDSIECRRRSAEVREKRGSLQDDQVHPSWGDLDELVQEEA